VPYRCRWVEGDLLHWASEATAKSDEPVDILHSAFAIHHLSDSEKQTLLEGLRTRIAPGGLFLWVDVFREAGESRDAYVQRYLQRISTGWLQLSAEQREHVSRHLASYDNPAERSAIETAAEAAGWQWRWAWSGAHRAEAMAVLTPA
jgi:phenylpropionate dioxygenase-like ring-hydroxylating dioxygenase large terminal subunit